MGNPLAKAPNGLIISYVPKTLDENGFCTFTFGYLHFLGEFKLLMKGIASGNYKREIYLYRVGITIGDRAFYLVKDDKSRQINIEIVKYFENEILEAILLKEEEDRKEPF